MKYWYPEKGQKFYVYDKFYKIESKGASFTATHIMAQAIDANDNNGKKRVFYKTDWLFFDRRMSTKKKEKRTESGVTDDEYVKKDL